MIGKVVTIGIACTNLEASKRFYHEQLGLQLVAGGQGWAVLSGGGVSISLWQGNEASTTIGLEGASADEVRAQLEAQGIAAGELQPHPGGRHYDVFDPDGNRVMISVSK